MNSDPILSAVLADLWTIRTKWTQDHSRNPPAAVVQYLATNQEVLRFFISKLYSTTTMEERQAIQLEHRELDYSAVRDGSLANEAVTRAVDIWSGDKLTDLTDDDINMLIRSIDYVKYLNCPPCPIALHLSPIQIL